MIGLARVKRGQQDAGEHQEHEPALLQRRRLTEHRDDHRQHVDEAAAALQEADEQADRRHVHEQDDEADRTDVQPQPALGHADLIERLQLQQA